MIWAGYAARMAHRRDPYRDFVGRHQGKRPLGRPRRRWKDNIKLNYIGTGFAWLSRGTGGGLLWMR
jgi:hypothetical protein